MKLLEPTLLSALWKCKHVHKTGKQILIAFQMQQIVNWSYYYSNKNASFACGVA